MSAADLGSAAAQATQEMGFYCFDVLAHHLKRAKDVLPPQFDDASYPLFVTWDIERNGHQELRGCIGNFNAMRLHNGLKEYALISALQDRRFAPIAASELPHLQCGVSLLVQFEDGNDYLDWTVGTHGIWIEFVDDGGRTKTATYLPQVAAEQGWTKVQAIDSLLRKGGFRGTISDRTRQAIKLTRYQSSKIEVSYSDYERWRQRQQ